MDKKDDKVNTSFAERHPKLNFVLGFLLLVLLLSIFIFLLLRFLVFLEFCINKLIQVSSKLDAVVIVALITGTVSLLGVVISSVFGKLLDYKKNRQVYLAQKRENAYKAFISMVYKIQENSRNTGSYSTDEMIKDTRYFSEELTLWGSPKVVDKWIEFRKKSLCDDNSENYMFLLEEIMNEMRKDMGCKKVKKGNLLLFFINDMSKHL